MVERSQGIRGKTILNEPLAIHTHGVLDFVAAVKEKLLMPDLEYGPYPLLFRYSLYSPVREKSVFKNKFIAVLEVS